MWCTMGSRRLGSLLTLLLGAIGSVGESHVALEAWEGVFRLLCCL